MTNPFAGTQDNLPHEYRLGYGMVGGVDIQRKFGANPAVGTTFVPISIGGVYRTPQVSGATALRVKAGGNANDTAAGTGAREITLIGLDATGAEISDTIETNGASASAPTTKEFIRLYRAIVSKSGAYATASAGSHAAAITIEDSGGSEDWLTIYATGFPAGQSEVACYTVPAGKTAYLGGVTILTETNKTCDLILFRRDNILDTAAPYSAMRVVKRFEGVDGPLPAPVYVPVPFPPLTDIGFMGKVSTGTAQVSVYFSMALIDT